MKTIFDRNGTYVEVPEYDTKELHLAVMAHLTYLAHGTRLNARQQAEVNNVIEHLNAVHFRLDSEITMAEVDAEIKARQG